MWSRMAAVHPCGLVLVYLHIQIPPTSYVGLILCSTLWLLQVTVPLKVQWGYSDATVTKGWEATAHAVAAEYPHSTLKGTPTCSSHSGTLSYETHAASQEEFGFVWACSILILLICGFCTICLNHAAVHKVASMTWRPRWQPYHRVIHIQIPPSSYVGLVLRSTAMATASWRVHWGYSNATVTEATVHAVAAEYPHKVATTVLHYKRHT